MAEHIHGPLYFERMGRGGPVMAFVHPNPMDQSCWIYQMAHMSTWYRCIAIDIPGYGRSPKADPGMTMDDMAQACWEAIDDAFPGETAILVGCSTGSRIVPHMNRLRPGRTAAIILTGTGLREGPPVLSPSVESYRKMGIEYRRLFTHNDLSPAFRATPMAHYFADLFSERNEWSDVDTIIYQFEALAMPSPEDLYSGVKCPAIILTGSEDGAHPRSFKLQEAIPGCELKVLPGAGHACYMEQPWLFDRFMIEFLSNNNLFPGSMKAMVATI
jgi:pimeloyl-ACP methyl ester carboxylesterase